MRNSLQIRWVAVFALTLFSVADGVDWDPDDIDWDNDAAERLGNFQKADIQGKLEMLPKPEALSGKSIVKFVGIVIGLVILLVVVSIICCCCLPCCFLAKRRTNRGTVHGPAVVQGGHHPQQELLQGAQYNSPQGAPYPTQGAYPPHTTYPAQNTYPPQGASFQQGGGYPPQVVSPPSYSDQPPPYPGPPLETYPTKQAPFNPNM